MKPGILLLAMSLLLMVSCVPEASVKTRDTEHNWQVGEMLQYSSQAISGDNLIFLEIVTTEGAAEQYITLYDLHTHKKERLITISSDLYIDPPAIDGNRIVWASVNRTEVDTYYGLDNGNWDVFLFDLTRRNIEQITTEPHAQMGARISGDNIVWLDARYRADDKEYPRPLDIYAYNVKSRVEKRLTSETTADGYASPTIDISGRVCLGDTDRLGVLHRRGKRKSLFHFLKKQICAGV